MNKVIQSQQQRLNDVDKHDVEIANQLLKATSKSYKKLVASINQLIIDYQQTDIILPSQKPKKHDLERLNVLVKELSSNFSKDEKKRLKWYMNIASLNMQFYVQALVGIQTIALHKQYAKINDKALHQDFDDELKFQKKQVKLPPKKVKKVAEQKETLINPDEQDKRIWSSHDVMVAAISVALIKMLRNQRRNELVAQMLPNYQFRRSIHGGSYKPIKHVGKELPINAYYQSEQYSQETAYRNKSSEMIRDESLAVFSKAGIKQVTIVNEFNPCSECRNYVGMIYDVEETPYIPVHSNCRCRIMQIDDGLSQSDISLLLGALASVSNLKNADKSGDEDVKEPDKDVIINEKELLPNLKNATIAEAKLTKYALDPNSEKGKDKAKVFKSALGYEKSNYKDLMQQVYDNLGKFKAVEKGKDNYGTRFEVNMMIHGPNGKTKNVLTAWRVKEDETWLTSIYVKDKG